MSRIFRIIMLLALLSASWPGQAQTVRQRDTSAFRATQLIAPGLLLATGLSIHLTGHEAIDVPVYQTFAHQREDKGVLKSTDVVLKYAPVLPMVVDLGLGLTGVPSKYDLQDRVIEAGLAAVVAGGTCLLMKNLISARRPDQSNYNSFPSGHTVLGFVGAELVRMNYGWAWGLGAYVVASGVAFMRVYSGRHWMSDILFGAGLGILGAHVGEWLLEPTKRLFNIGPLVVGKDKREIHPSFAPTLDPYSGAVCASLALAF